MWSCGDLTPAQDLRQPQHENLIGTTCVQAARRAAVPDAALQRRRGPGDRRPAGGAGGSVHGAGDGAHRRQLRARRPAGQRHRQRPAARALPAIVHITTFFCFQFANLRTQM